MVIRISIHTSLTGSDSPALSLKEKNQYFNPHFPHGKWQLPKVCTLCWSHDFNPHFPHGKWRKWKWFILGHFTFQSTLPSREVTQNRALWYAWGHISIHTSLTGSDWLQSYQGANVLISIHTSLTGSDNNGRKKILLCGQISIHTSLTGSDEDSGYLAMAFQAFQSTLPSREVTEYMTSLYRRNRFQSTLPSREVTLINSNTCTSSLFQSTLPSREVTGQWKKWRKDIIFQSTLPSREVTMCVQSICDKHQFQSTLPSREVTFPKLYKDTQRWGFQSTLPSREVTTICDK